MSHVSALPRAPSASVLEESAAEATQFALATLESFPSVFEKLDAGDAAVVTLGAAVVARAAAAAAEDRAQDKKGLLEAFTGGGVTDIDPSPQVVWGGGVSAGSIADLRAAEDFVSRACEGGEQATRRACC